MEDVRTIRYLIVDSDGSISGVGHTTSSRADISLNSTPGVFDVSNMSAEEFEVIRSNPHLFYVTSNAVLEREPISVSANKLSVFPLEDITIDVHPGPDVEFVSCSVNCEGESMRIELNPGSNVLQFESSGIYVISPLPPYAFDNIVIEVVDDA